LKIYELLKFFISFISKFLLANVIKKFDEFLMHIIADYNNSKYKSIIMNVINMDILFMNMKAIHQECTILNITKIF